MTIDTTYEATTPEESSATCSNVFGTAIDRARRRGRANARRVLFSSLLVGLLLTVMSGAITPTWSAAATSTDKTLFRDVASSYDAAATEFNLVIASFSACSTVTCVSAAIEATGDIRFYQATLALEKKGPYPSGVSKDLNVYIGNLISIQKDVNAVAKAKTIARQKTLTTSTLELDVDNLSFRGIAILIYLGEQPKY